MSEQEQQTGSNATRSLSDETIRLYLLGGSPDNERSMLEQQLLNDDELAERVLLAETELADDYAAGRLSAAEQDLFQTKFLVTDARQRKLEVSTIVREYVSSHSDAQTVSTADPRPPQSWVEAFLDLTGLNRRPAWALAGSFALLLLFAGVVLIALNRGRGNEPQVVKLESAPTPRLSPVTEPSPSTAASPAPATTQPTPLKKPERIPPPEEPSTPPAIATFVLLPGAVRDGGDMTRVALPDGGRGILRLQLVVETSGDGQPYRAELLTAERQAVLVRDNLKTSISKAGERVVLDIPAHLLKDGDYQVKLGRLRAGEIEPVARYYFRALQ